VNFAAMEQLVSMRQGCLFSAEKTAVEFATGQSITWEEAHLASRAGSLSALH